MLRRQKERENFMESIAERLIDKSIEAFILGLEIYNKPTIKYRIEGFSFFICNAWELMLKAHIIIEKGNNAIYFKDNQKRTISLENAIDIIFPDKYGNLRKNLLQIIKLRNTSTHFVTEDYEHIYAPLFQACVANFINKMQEFHKIDITKKIAQNFLTLSVRIDQLSTAEIRAKYTPEMAEKLIADKSKIEQKILENNSDFAIPVETRFYITKNRSEADLTVHLDKNSDNKLKLLRELKNPNDLYPLTTKEVIKIINKRLKAKDILLTKFKSGEKILTSFTTHDLKLFSDFYNIKSDNRYCFHYKIGNRYGYSPLLCDFIIEEVQKNPVNFVSNLKKQKK